MTEKDLDKLLEQQRAAAVPIASERKFQQKVRWAMNRTLYTRIVAAVLALALLAVGLFLGTSKTIDWVFYDPGKEPSFLEQDSRAGVDFTLLLEDTISTYFPGKYCWVLGEYERSGFSRYGVDLLITDSYGPKVLAGPATDHFDIAFSKLDMGNASLNIRAMEFVDPATYNTMGSQQAAMLTPLEPVREELQKLPQSAYLDVSMSFSASLTSSQVAELISAYPDVHFRWLALEDQNVTKYEFAAGGMFLDHIRGEQFTAEAAKKYPDYFLPQHITGESLERCLSSRLQLLIDHPDFVDLMETQFGDMISRDMLQKRLANAQEKWACYGMRLTAEPEVIAELMEKLDATQVQINDVKVSRYEK